MFYQSEINSGNWTQINKYRHNPFQSFHYAALNNETILGKSLELSFSAIIKKIRAHRSVQSTCFGCIWELRIILKNIEISNIILDLCTFINNKYQYNKYNELSNVRIV